MITPAKPKLDLFTVFAKVVNKIREEIFSTFNKESLLYYPKDKKEVSVKFKNVTLGFDNTTYLYKFSENNNNSKESKRKSVEFQEAETRYNITVDTPEILLEKIEIISLVGSLLTNTEQCKECLTNFKKANSNETEKITFYHAFCLLVVESARNPILFVSVLYRILNNMDIDLGINYQISHLWNAGSGITTDDQALKAIQALSKIAMFPDFTRYIDAAAKELPSLPPAKKFYFDITTMYLNAQNYNHLCELHESIKKLYPEFYKNIEQNFFNNWLNSNSINCVLYKLNELKITITEEQTAVQKEIPESRSPSPDLH